MRIFIILALADVMLFASNFKTVDGSSSKEKQKDTEKQKDVEVQKEIEFKGITFVGDKYCPEVSYEDPLSKLSMENLQKTGANWVAIVVTEYQDGPHSTTIGPLYDDDIQKNEYYTYKTESIKGLTELIQHAHEIGLQVLLKPHIDLVLKSDYRSTWRGQIGDAFTTEKEWSDWFDSYEKFILKYATLAETLNVELFSVSCELITASHKDAQWRKIIQEIRKVYNGLLVDSANHDGEEYGKGWWDVLDYIGVDAYYLPITSSVLERFEETVEKYLESSAKMLSNLNNQFHKPVIITEIGFCSGNCVIGDRTYKPTQADHDIQAFFYDEFIKMLNKNDFVKGFFWWAWNSDPYYGGDKDHCISPQNKKAEKVLRKWYGGDVNDVNYESDSRAKCVCTI